MTTFSNLIFINLIYLFFQSIIIPLNALLKPYDRNKWYCGTDSIMHGIAKTVTINSCTLDEYVLINRCCYHHDNCYELKLGKERCDKQFCKCMKVKSKTCKLLTLGFCFATEGYGLDAYKEL
ncbi:Phospholipase A2 domain-containing protein [Strongyloides ratti]|uniref:Phospholipase A2 domain-containing protein n=1 Tax=Strongyloides ratti TaxID=34506 RepID=A0A090L530_STRRB|nr:Phospholipase A2 domain-containing protein [Strongyloides ratti]CEF62599.1 Phospholipase A2 domain-containing protein [Strongyloides ratti]